MLRPRVLNGRNGFSVAAGRNPCKLLILSGMTVCNQRAGGSDSSAGSITHTKHSRLETGTPQGGFSGTYWLGARFEIVSTSGRDRQDFQALGREQKRPARRSATDRSPCRGGACFSLPFDFERERQSVWCGTRRFLPKTDGPSISTLRTSDSSPAAAAWRTSIGTCVCRLVVLNCRWPRIV